MKKKKYNPQSSRFLNFLCSGIVAIAPLLSGCENPTPTPSPEPLEEICNQPIPEGYVDVSGTWIEKGFNGFNGTIYTLDQCGTDVKGRTSYHADVFGWVRDENILEFYVDLPLNGTNDCFSGTVNANNFEGTKVSKYNRYVFNTDLIRWSSATEIPEQKDANGNMLAPWVELESDRWIDGNRTITWTIHNTKAGQNYLQWLSFDSGQNPCDGSYNVGGHADPGIFTATAGDGIALRIEDNDSNPYNDKYLDYDSATQTYKTKYSKGQVGIRIYDNQGYMDCDHP